MEAITTFLSPKIVDFGHSGKDVRSTWTSFIFIIVCMLAGSQIWHTAPPGVALEKRPQHF
jgi:hypothetical protein